MADAPPLPPLQWDLFCRVIDNFGDAGVCWRLARSLAARGLRVRLVIDDATPLAWMAPGGDAGVDVMPWPGPATPGDVVIEAFGCDPPPAFVQAMAAAAQPPVWINLEYLSAEAYVERSHGLPSPQRNGLTKWFFYPGFSAATGGLLREPGLLQARAAFDRPAWLAGLGLALQPGERVVSLFCYANAHTPALLQRLSEQPTLLLLTPGLAQQQVPAAVQLPPALRVARLPWLPQPAFDQLLWASDLNFVRGEDSLVRAVWAGAAFAWQAYPQDDGAHAAKLQALLTQLQAPADMVAFWWAWNGLAETPLPALPPLQPWQDAVQGWRARLLAQAEGADLAERLCAFVRGKSRSAAPGC